MPYKVKVPRRYQPKKHDSRTTLLDLPTELLLQILSDTTAFSPRDLYNVAQLSKRLRALALPIFLAYHDIRDPETETSLYVIEWDPKRTLVSRNPDALSGLNISTHISRINRFRCFFQDPDSKSLRNTFQKVFDLSEAVQRTCRFVNKLEGVTTAEIYLVWDPYFTTRERNVNYIPWAELKKWTHAFGHMLNLLIERGCTSLTVQYEASISPLFHFRPANRVKKAVSYISHNVLRLEGQSPDLQWEFERSLLEDKSIAQEPEPIALLSPVSQAVNSVTSLAIHSPVLLLPPFLKWTLSLLRTHSNLTSISFAYISFSKETWAIILPFIAEEVSHRLTELSFFRSCPHLEASDLLQFIGHLPKLTHLSVDRSFRIKFNNIKPRKILFQSQSSSISLSPPKFPNLHTLRCPVEMVSYLLGPRESSTQNSASISLPALRFLTVYPCNLLMHPPSYVHSSLVVSDLLHRIQSERRSHNVVFALDAQMEFTDFGPVARYFETIRTRGEFQRALRESLDPADIQRLKERGTDLAGIAFEHVVHVVLYRFGFVMKSPDRTPAALCLWLNTLFPSVERLTFTCRLDAHPQVDFHMDEDTIQCLMNELIVVCPKVRTLVVGQTTYELAS